MKQRRCSHSVYPLEVELVFCTKYRYRVLRDEILEQCRDLIRQVCDGLDVCIVKGVVSADHQLSYLQPRRTAGLVRRLQPVEIRTACGVSRPGLFQ